MIQIDSPIRDALQFLSGRLLVAKVTGDRLYLVVESTGENQEQEAELKARIAHATAPLGIATVQLGLTAQRATARLIAVGSGKGGVGKSTVAANLAVALTGLGRRAGLIDADIHGPSQPHLLSASDQRPQEAPRRGDGRPRLAPTITPEGVGLLSLGQMVAPGRALAWRGAMAGKALAQLLDGDWADYDPVIVDLPPGTGDVQLSLLKSHRPAGAVIVSTPQDLALIDARRAIDLFAQTGVPVIGLVENMSGYLCPHCHQSSDPFGAGGVAAEARALGVPLLARIPLDAGIRAASDAGRSVAGGAGGDAAPFVALARQINQWLDTGSVGTAAEVGNV